MSVITIKYGDLEDTSKYSKKLSQTLNGYADELSRRITSPINSLPGNDNRGYASNAAYSANRKIKELRDRSNRFSSFSQKIDQFASNVQKADNRVANSIKNTASSYVGERSAWQGFCDFLWGAICVDFFNSTNIGRAISDCIKSGWSYVTQTAEKVYDWFKYGDGQYIWNMVSSFAATGAAIIGAVLAFVAIPFTAGTSIAILIGCIAFAASAIGALITTANSAVKFYNNYKAMSQYEEDPGVASYLGKIDGVSSAIEKYDMGDAEDNANWEVGGKGVDNTKLTCDIIGIVTSFVNVGGVKDSRSGKIVGYKFSKENIKFNIKNMFGFDADTNSFSLKKMLKPDVGQGKSDKLFGPYGLEFLNGLSPRAQRGIKTTVEVVNITNSVMGKVEKGETVYSNLKEGISFKKGGNGWKTIKSSGSVLSTFSAFDPINKFIIKPIDAGIDIHDEVFLST